jgi:hypothetical protein
MQRKQFVLREKKAVRKASMRTVQAESRSDRQLFREILDRRHEVSVILS